jgi:hypothetical protein
MTFLCFLGSSALGYTAVHDTYMEPWFVMACSVNFGTRIDQSTRDQSGEFYNFHPFSVAQSAGGFY